MAENERRLAEINERENKLKAQAAQFGMEPAFNQRDKIDDYQPYRRNHRSPSPRKRSYRSPSPVVKCRTFDDHHTSSPVNRITIKNDKYKQRSPSPPPKRRNWSPERKHQQQRRRKSRSRTPPPPRKSRSPKRPRSSRKSPEPPRTRMRSDPEASDHHLPEPKRRYERSRTPIELSDEEKPVKTENFDHIEAAFEKLKAKKEAESKKQLSKKPKKPKKKKEAPIEEPKVAPPPPRLEQQQSRNLTKAESITIQTSAYFNQEIKRAIADGRLKVHEDDILETGPNYSHTTNGRELEYQQRRIFVGHLPVDFLSKDEIYFMFQSYGTIIAIRFNSVN